MKKISLLNAINSVQTSPSSIFSKDDVLTLLGKISVGINQDELQNILDGIQIIEPDQIEEMVSNSCYKLEMNHNEVSIASVDIDQHQIDNADLEFKKLVMTSVAEFLADPQGQDLV